VELKFSLVFEDTMLYVIGYFIIFLICTQVERILNMFKPLIQKHADILEIVAMKPLPRHKISNVQCGFS
jgi:hypothetical protein